MSKKVNTVLGVLGFYFVIVLIGIIGWVMNLYKLSQCDFEQPYQAEIIRVVGIFPLVGAVTGYISISDEKEITTNDTLKNEEVSK